MRLFVALEIPAKLREALAARLRQVAGKGDGVRWVRPELWHLTLRFLGEVGEDRLPAVTGALAAATEGVRSFAWECRGLGAFPDLRRPRVLWAGIDRGAPEMAALAGRIEDALAGPGFPREDRPFHPHLTLGRAAGSGPLAARVREAFRREETTLFGGGVAEQVLLVASRLAPAGPEYTPVEVWGLAR